MALSDDLRDYMAKHGQAATKLESDAPVVIIGETHGFLKSDAAAIRTTAMTRLVRELLNDPRYRYFGNESFQNAGAVRRGIRDYWMRGVLPPEFTAGNAADEALDTQEVGRRVMPRRFKPVLDDLKAKPRYVLSIGSRMSGDIRDRRLAQHFFEEVKDRGIARHTPGVLLLGAAHAAATPFNMGQTTTRMILEKHGFKCTSILVMTDFAAGDQSDDSVFPLASGSPPRTKLGGLATKSPISFSTRHPTGGIATSPFHQVREEFSDSGQSIAEQFEHIVLHKA
jgi:hypothetical protein